MSGKAAPVDDEILDEEALRRVAKNVKKLVPTTDENEAIQSLDRLLEKVFHALEDPYQSATRRVAAINALCALIDHVSTSEVAPFQQFFWDKQIWTRACRVYIQGASFTKPRASRQLLTSLTNALHCNRDRSHVYNEQLDIVVHDQVTLLNETESSDQIKTAVSILSYFLSKDVLKLSQLLQQFEHQQQTSELSALQRFLLVLFEWINKADLGSSIGQLVANVLQRAEQDNILPPGTAQTPIWFAPLERAAKNAQVDSDHLRVHLLPLLFKRNVEDYTALLVHLRSEHAPQMSNDMYGQIPSIEEPSDLYYASLRCGKECGLLVETDGDTMILSQDVVLIPFETIASFFRSVSRTARLTALSLLIDSPMVTRPYNPVALHLIRENFTQLLNDQDAGFRGEVSSLLKRLIHRMRTATATLAKHERNDTIDSSPNSGDEVSQAFEEHRKFLCWLKSAVFWELRPTASYQSHISALNCLSSLVRSGLDASVAEKDRARQASDSVKWPFTIQIVCHELQCLLLDLLVNPFDDVRQTTASILAVCSVVPNRSLCSMIGAALARAEQKMLTTGRADQADGVAHLYALLNRLEASTSAPDPRVSNAASVTTRLVTQLESALQKANTNLLAAVESYPVHGLFTSLRLVLTQNPLVVTHDRDMNQRVQKCLVSLWDIVKPILCDDAPEGYLPESIDEVASVTTRDTLSYCWRALKEASLLTASLVSWLGRADVVTEVQGTRIADMAELCFQQLAELRHRGAFSTVAQTWVVCCTQSRNLNAGQTPILQSWSDRVFNMLRTRTTINTRRSAGIPSLVCGILIAEQSETFFLRVVEDLENIAREPVSPSIAKEGSLPQVHAMNCLKDILKNTKLSELSDRIIPRALRLAADALRSEAWAVRNCGLMLFRAATDRLLGTSEAYLDDEIRAEGIVSEEQCPGLLSVVLDLLSNEHGDERNNEGVFPGLQLLQKLRIPMDRVNSVQQTLLALNSDPVWHIRDKAARTYASCVAPDQAVDTINRITNPDVTQQNRVHGILLCVRYIIRRVGANQSKDTVDEHCHKLVHALLLSTHLYHNNDCTITRGSFIDAVREGFLPMSIRGRNKCFAALRHEGIDLLTEMQKTLDITRPDPTLPVLRLALARTWSVNIYCLLEEYGDATILQRVVNLAAADADACIELLQNINIHDSDTRAVLDVAICNICSAIVRDTSISTAVKAEAQRLSLSILRQRKPDSKLLSITAHDLCATHGQLPPDAAQSNYDLALQIRTISLGNATSGQALLSHELLASFQLWMHDCLMGMSEKGCYSREAVASAIEDLRDAVPVIAATSSAQDVFCKLCSIVYDLLNDDDEDLRLGASQPALRILRTETNQPQIVGSLTPLLAGQQLAEFMSRKFSNTPSFASMVISRAFGVSSQEEASIAARLSRLQHRNLALFAEEKSNLYIDEAREARIWSLITYRSSPAGLDEQAMARLSLWTEQSLVALDRLVEADVSGPVGGPASDEEVFVLGLQVIYAAEWYIRLGTAKAVSIYDHLVALSGKHQLHPLWAAEIRSVVARNDDRKQQTMEADILPFAASAQIGF